MGWRGLLVDLLKFCDNIGLVRFCLGNQLVWRFCRCPECKLVAVEADPKRLPSMLHQIGLRCSKPVSQSSLTTSLPRFPSRLCENAFEL